MNRSNRQYMGDECKMLNKNQWAGDDIKNAICTSVKSHFSISYLEDQPLSTSREITNF